MPFLYKLEWFSVFAVGFLLVFQVVIPVIAGTPIFGWFRSKKREDIVEAAIANKEDAIADKTVAEIEKETAAIKSETEAIKTGEGNVNQ